MKRSLSKAAFLSALCALSLAANPLRAAAATDSVTGLPLYPGAGTTPDSTTSAPICSSKGKFNNYDLLSGSDAAALTWFAANLHDFKHTHGVGMDRRQDLFLKTDGSVAVAVTSGPNRVSLYGVGYMRFTPPLTSSEQMKFGKLMSGC